MLHLLYILAFTIIAFIAISNLIRSLITISTDQHRYSSAKPSSSRGISAYQPKVSHPELLDDDGRLLNEPLLVMRSVSVEDAREQLDAIYNSSPGSSNEED